MSTKLKGRPGVPTTKLTKVLVNTATIIMQEDSQLTECLLAQILQIVSSTVHILLTEKLGLVRVFARWIPHLLTKERVEHVRILHLMLANWKHETVCFDNVITCDELKVYHYDSKMKQQSTHWVKKGFALPKKLRAQKPQLKIMVITFRDWRGMIYTHYCSAGKLRIWLSTRKWSRNQFVPTFQKNGRSTEGRMEAPPKQWEATCFEGDACIFFFFLLRIVMLKVFILINSYR